MTQVELMGDKDAGSDSIDPTKAGVRVWKTVNRQRGKSKQV
jgi:hypothetical protein